MTQESFSSDHRSTTAAARWSPEVQVWWRDFDELGHMTAAAYPAAFEEGVGRFITERWGEHSPAYVTAGTTLDYVREVRRADLPITIGVGVQRVGRASFTLDLVLSDASGTRCCVATTRYVAWDRERRGPRPLAQTERQSLLRLAPRAGSSLCE